MMLLHAMVRVRDLEKSLAFHRDPDGYDVEIIESRGLGSGKG